MKERILGVYTISICSLFILTSYSSAISTYQETVPITIDHKQLPIVYIDDDYNENTPGWGFDHFSRIQHGINAIETGGTAIVFNGIYYENVIVDKTINLIGESKENTIIDAQGSGNVVFISSSQVSMSEFTIRNSAIVDYHYGCFYGLLLTNTMQTRIENILVDNNDIGIGLYQSVSNHITQSTIKNSSNQGIKIFESNNNTIENVICYDNMYGIFVGYSQQVKIKNTTTYHNSYGIYLASANNNRLENNTIYSNINWGIFLEHAEHNTLRNNEMARNTYNFWIDTYANSPLYYQDIDTSNTVDAKPIYYLVDVQDYVIPTDAGFVGVIHSENITVKNITFSNNSDGVVFALTTNSTIDNVTVTNCYHGIHLWNSDQNTITRYYGSQNIVGIYLEYFSNNNNITNNTCILSNYGLVTQYQCNNNIITYNRFILNFLDIEEYCSPNIFLFNQFSFNLENRMMQFQEVEREKILNDEVEFSLSIYDAQGNPCDDFNYSIQTSPSELVSANHQGNMLMGSFRLTMNGTYSLIVTVCDNNNNTVRNRWTFFVNPTGVETIQYYLRSVAPSHGQPYAPDSGSLLYSSPVKQEVIYCSDWVQCSPNNLPSSHPLSLLDEINIYSWYSSQTPGVMGVQRYWTYWIDIDKSVNIDPSPEYSWTYMTIPNIHWSMDNPLSWYLLALKIYCPQGYPHWMSQPLQPSYATLTYRYTKTPAIRSNSNTNVIILSMTSLATNSNNATIMVEGCGMTTLVVQMPNTSLVYSVKFDGTDCNCSNCTFIQSNGELHITLRLTSEHILEIRPAQNHPPYVPCNPFPPDFARNVNVYSNLNWTDGDPDHDLVTYDVYFGTTNPPPLMIHNISTTTVNPGKELDMSGGHMAGITKYFWKIVAWDDSELNNEGPIWCFKTAYAYELYQSYDQNN